MMTDIAFLPQNYRPGEPLSAVYKRRSIVDGSFILIIRHNSGDVVVADAYSDTIDPEERAQELALLRDLALAHFAGVQA